PWKRLPDGTRRHFGASGRSPSAFPEPAGSLARPAGLAGKHASQHRWGGVYRWPVRLGVVSSGVGASGRRKRGLTAGSAGRGGATPARRLRRPAESGRSLGGRRSAGGDAYLVAELDGRTVRLR